MYQFNHIKKQNEILKKNPNHKYTPRCEYCGEWMQDWNEYNAHNTGYCSGKNTYKQMMDDKYNIEKHYEYNYQNKSQTGDVFGVNVVDTMGSVDMNINTVDPTPKQTKSALDMLGLGDVDADNGEQKLGNEDVEDDDIDQHMKSPTLVANDDDDNDQHMKSPPRDLNITSNTNNVNQSQFEQEFQQKQRTRDKHRSKRQADSDSDDAMNPLVTFEKQFHVKERMQQFKENVFDYTLIQGGEQQVKQVLFTSYEIYNMIYIDFFSNVYIYIYI